MEIYTIGFTKKSAADFFEPLRKHSIDRLVDVRINNTSQLAGFTKRDDLNYFLHELLEAEYVHEPRLAPTKELLEAYRNGALDWPAYEDAFIGLMSERRIEETIPKGLFAGNVVLLCSEATADRCHRRLVLEYLDRAWGGVEAIHL